MGLLSSLQKQFAQLELEYSSFTHCIPLYTSTPQDISGLAQTAVITLFNKNMKFFFLKKEITKSC